MTESTMQDFQLNDEGICCTCNVLSLDQEFVECGICDKKFHAVCSSCSADDKWATKTMIQMFKASSTKRNFRFSCNYCLTALETNKADVNGLRVRKLEENMDRINSELKKITELVTPKEAAVKPSTAPSDQRKSNIWFDEEKLASVKAKPAESVLVINKGANSTVDKTNQDLVENMVVQGKIPVTKAYKNKEGNFVVVCDSTETRNTLKDQVHASNNNIELKTPREKRPAISIVGLAKNYENQEVVDLLVKQNIFLRQFSMGNNINDHISVFAVKRVRGKEGVYQAFARVSQLLRQGLRTFKDKVILGLSTCTIYDQFHVKRCNNCQSFGHYYKNCSHPAHVCAKCGGNHSTRECQSEDIMCTNCSKAGVEQCNHRADDQKCPTLCKIQDKMRKSYNFNNLN